jgi:replicative DNA helicase
MPRRPNSQPPPRRPSSPIEALVERIDAVQDRRAAPTGIPSGFASLDTVLGGGFRRQDLVVLAGDVGSGKSSLALGMALRTAGHGNRVLFLSGEMGEERLMERALAIEGRTALDDLRRGQLPDEVRAAVGAAALRLRGLPLVFGRLHGSDFSDISDAIDRAAEPLDLLIIDSLQQAGGTGASTEERVADATRRLKALALNREVAVLALAHLPLLIPSREDRRPTLDDLGGGGAVKQHADVVLGLYREEMYRPGGGIEGATELNIAKNRGGPTGFIDLYYHRHWLRFEDLLDRGP